MKTIISIILVTSVASATPQLTWVDQKVKEIKPKRVGMNNHTYKKLKDPFIYLKSESKAKVKITESNSNNANSIPVDGKKPKVKGKNEPLKLIMVMNNSALINGTWYKKGELIQGYELTEVNAQYISLKSKKKVKRIFLNEKNPNIKLNIK